MATDLYGQILEELGELLGVELEPDSHHTCLIKVKPGVEIYVELTRDGNFIDMAAKLGDVPPGPYREGVFREALKMNGKKAPRLGIFAYSPQARSLVFYKRTEVDRATGAYLFALILPFAKIAHTWKEALERGDIPEADVEGGPSSSSSNVFGIRP